MSDWSKETAIQTQHESRAARPGDPGEPTSNRVMILRGLVWPVLSDFILPFLLYLGARQLGLSTLLALVVPSVWYIARMFVSFARGARIDRLAIFILVLVVAGMAASLVSGSARLAVVKDSAFTGVVGLFFLATRVSGRSVMSPAFRTIVMGRSEGGNAIWDDFWQRSAAFRRHFHRLDTVWGIGLLLEAAVRIVAALLMPVSTVVNLSTPLMALTFVLLASWNGIQGKALGRLLRSENLVPEPARQQMGE